MLFRNDFFVGGRSSKIDSNFSDARDSIVLKIKKRTNVYFKSCLVSSSRSLRKGTKSLKRRDSGKLLAFATTCALIFLFSFFLTFQRGWTLEKKHGASLCYEAKRRRLYRSRRVQHDSQSRRGPCPNNADVRHRRVIIYSLHEIISTASPNGAESMAKFGSDKIFAI